VTVLLDMDRAERGVAGVIPVCGGGCGGEEC